MTVQDQAKQLKKDIKQFVNDGGYVWGHKVKAPKYAGGGEYYTIAFETKIGKRDKQEELIALQSLILPEGWSAYWTGTRIEMYKRVDEGELQMVDIQYNQSPKLQFERLQ
jgi:hypothetical protein